ncbi:MAG: glycosyltransferase [Kiritimatiellae bacterium]|nr:glycosyltransferase [Kiritimatiellia bacterium]
MLIHFTYEKRPERSVTIMMVGRFVEKKGMAYGIRAFAKGHEQYPDIRLRIIGSGPLQSSYEALIAEEKCQDAVYFTGT